MPKKSDGFESEKIIVLPSYVLDEVSSHPLTQQTYITDIGYFPRAMNHFRERPQGCDSYILIYCAAGKGWVSMAGQERISIGEQSLIIIPAETPHAYGADDISPWSIYWLHLRGDQVKYFLALLEPSPGYLQVQASDDTKFLELFNQCYDLLSAKSYSIIHLVYVSQTVRYLLGFILTLASRKDESKSQMHIDKAIRYFNEHLQTNVTLEEISLYVQVSKQHLNNLFKQSTGNSPIDYYLRLKMQRAGQLLDLTDATIKEISITLGFKDPYYFSRLFKKIIGYSPTVYRNHLKG
ncbi:MAG: AraC family transcriptional regulator [Gorillibacterium sp.]|nr:AraC family transcriptional regulator [Gorillibacterium sp.]